VNTSVVHTYVYLYQLTTYLKPRRRGCNTRMSPPIASFLRHYKLREQKLGPAERHTEDRRRTAPQNRQERFFEQQNLLAGVEITLPLDAYKAQCVRRGKRNKCAGSFWQHPSGTRILDSARYSSFDFIAVLELASSSSIKTEVHGVLITTNLLKFQCHLKSESQGVLAVQLLKPL